MSKAARFAYSPGDVQATAYHYTGCGLDDIYLVSGFKRHDTPYGAGVSIENLDELHLAIGAHIICNRKALSPKEFRFLRKNMNLTQDRMGQCMGVTGQTIARYEKGESEISGPADKLMRVIYAVHLLPDDEKLTFIQRLEDAAQRMSDRDDEGAPTFFGPAGSKWQERPPAPALV